MKKVRNLTLVALVFLFILPSVIQFGSNPVETNIELSKNYTESYVHHDAIWIQSNAEFEAQATLESWAGDGSGETPYVITGYLFDCETQPLRIWHTTVHWIFTDNEIFGVGGNIQCGSWVENVTNGAIIDNEVHNRHAGLAIADVENFIISDNYIHDCWGRGIELFGAMNSTVIENNVIDNIGESGIYSITSRDCIIKNNTISDCAEGGITLVGQTPNCTVVDNDISHCEGSGILMANVNEGEVKDNSISNVGSHGIYLSSLTDCLISGNTIDVTDRSGIRVSAAEFCEISENVIEDCSEDGMLLSSGTNTTVEWNSVTNVSEYTVNLESSSSFFSVKYNTFIDNAGSCQVCDDGTSNIVSHNYYDDWDSPDEDANGYVDSPYAFDGDSENQDEFPLAEAGVVPTTEVEPTPTTGTGGDNPLPMYLIIIAGAVGAIVLIAGILLLKRR